MNMTSAKLRLLQRQSSSTVLPRTYSTARLRFNKVGLSWVQTERSSQPKDCLRAEILRGASSWYETKAVSRDVATGFIFPLIQSFNQRMRICWCSDWFRNSAKGRAPFFIRLVVFRPRLRYSYFSSADLRLKYFYDYS